MTISRLYMVAEEGLSQGDKIANFTIVRHLNSGGMGEVYLGRDDSSGQDVAIKILIKNYVDDDNIRKRFEHEAHLLKILSHPNVVNLISSGTHNGLPYIVMEYVDGVLLRDLIRDKASDLASSMYFMKQLLAAVRYLHSRKIVHRDIKPNNIMVLPDRSVKILDFGISKDLSSDSDMELTQVGDVMGAIKYLPPEYATKAASSIQADIRNLGVIFYELLVWRYPIKFKDKVDLALKIKTTNIEFPKRDRTPEPLKQIILKMTDVDLEKRYKRISDVQRDLRAIDIVEVTKTMVLAELERSKVEKVFNVTKKLFVETASFSASLEDFLIEADKKGHLSRSIGIFAVVFTLFVGTQVWRIESDAPKPVVDGGMVDSPTEPAMDAAAEPSATRIQGQDFGKSEELSNSESNSDVAKEQTKSVKREPSQRLGQKRESRKAKARSRKRTRKVVRKDISKKQSKPVSRRLRSQPEAVTKPSPKVVEAVPESPAKEILNKPELLQADRTLQLDSYNQDNVKLAWQGQKEAQTSEIFISSDAKFRKVLVNVNVGRQNSYDWKPPMPGTYYWFVKLHAAQSKATEVSQVGRLTLKSSAPQVSIRSTRSLRSPAATGKSFMFEWGQQRRPGRYLVQVSLDRNFRGPAKKNEVVSEPSYVFEAKDPGQYFLRVAELDPFKSIRVSPYSKLISFMIEPVKFKLQPPRLLGPDNESELMYSDIPRSQFKWQSGQDGVSYQIQIATQRNFSDVILDKGMLIDYMPIPSALNAGKYYWRVRTKLSGETSDWSDTYYFIVGN